MPTHAPVTGSSYELPPEGSHPVRHVQHIDLGTQSSAFGDHRVCLLGYEIASDEPLGEGELAPMVWERCRWTMNERSKLRSRVEALLGRRLTDAEAAGVDIPGLARTATPALIEIIHNESAGRVFANVKSLVAVPKGLVVPPARSKPIVFDLDAVDMEVFDSLSERLRETIQASPEWAMRNLAANDDVPF